MSNHANNNIRMITETVALGESSATLYTSYGYDSAPLAEAQLPLRGVPHVLPTLPCWDRRAGADRCRIPSGGEELRCESIRRPRESSARRNRVRRVTQDWELTRRDHDYDAAGRLIKSTYRQWWEKDEEPSGDSVEHCYAGSKHIQNHDGDSSYGAVWHWAGAQNSLAPVKSPNADTASQDGYNISNAKTPQRTTWQTPTSAGDERNLYGQGKPMPKDSSGSGADWGTGIESVTVDATVLTVNSRLDFDGTVAPTDLDRATDAREKSRIGIFGSSLAYAGSSGRVTSEQLGSDLNPLGRGSGAALVGGAMNLGQLCPVLPAGQARSGSGNSVNNCGQCGGGGMDSTPPSGGSTSVTGDGTYCCDCSFAPTHCSGLVHVAGVFEDIEHFECCDEEKCFLPCKGEAGIEKPIPCPEGPPANCDLRGDPCKDHAGPGVACICGRDMPKEYTFADGCPINIQRAFHWLLYKMKFTRCCLGQITDIDARDKLENAIFKISSQHGEGVPHVYPFICCESYRGGLMQPDKWTESKEGHFAGVSYGDHGELGLKPGMCTEACTDIGYGGACMQTYTGAKSGAFDPYAHQINWTFVCWDRFEIGCRGYNTARFTCALMGVVVHEIIRQQGYHHKPPVEGQWFPGIPEFVHCICDAQLWENTQ